MSDNRIFRMTNFSPIGFKTINYPVPHCPLCRGFLIEPCNICIEKQSDKCNVIMIDNVNYHEHCHTFMNDASVKTKSGK